MERGRCPERNSLSANRAAPHNGGMQMHHMTLPSEGAARCALDQLPGISWRPFGREDLPVIAAFYTECEAYDENPERSSLADLEEFWNSPRSVPEEDTLVGRDTDGRIVATAWAGCNRAVTERRGVRLAGAVRPDRRGEGIGRAVLQWELAHGFRPAWTVLAIDEDTDRVIGAAMNYAWEQD